MTLSWCDHGLHVDIELSSIW